MSVSFFSDKSRGILMMPHSVTTNKIYKRCSMSHQKKNERLYNAIYT
nr:MAG TPA: hypothetical protein [Caudoviricetes sp.]